MRDDPGYDLAASGESVLLDSGSSEQTRATETELVERCFDPGGIIATVEPVHQTWTRPI